MTAVELAILAEARRKALVLVAWEEASQRGGVQ